MRLLLKKHNLELSTLESEYDQEKNLLKRFIMK